MKAASARKAVDWESLFWIVAMVAAGAFVMWRY